MALAVVKSATTMMSPDKRRPMVSIDSVTMSFGTFIAVQNVDLTVADGEFLAIVGPTGCGKSTILNAIAGLLKPASGTVSIDGAPVHGVQNNIGYLFQQDALLPWKTALENVELGPM
ncbi:MAG: ABC transporter ATP-binding protein, partial [Mesorhizobium sp.]